MKTRNKDVTAAYLRGKPVDAAYRNSKNVFSGGGVTPPFAPTDISGLALWLDASDASTLWADTAGTIPATSTVARWNDKSGNSNNATQGTGINQPITGSSNINGINAISFDGTNDFFNLNSDIAPTTSMFYFAVIKCVATANLQALFSGSTAGSPVWRLNQTEQIQIVRRAQAILTTSSEGLTDATDYIILSTSRNGLNQTYIDGTVAGGEITTNPAYTQPINQIGLEAMSNYFASKLGELFIFTQEPTTEQKNQLGEYVAAKWGPAAFTSAFSGGFL
jgi:hypothetical protein